MKIAAKKWWNYLLTLLGVGIIVGLGVALFYVIGEPKWPLIYSWYFMIFGGVVVVLLGFVIQDLYRGWNRHKLHDWDNPLPDKVVNRAWAIFFPLLWSGLISFLVGLIAFLLTK